MVTNIFNYNGTKLTTVPDGRIDTTSASIKFPGYGFLNYGEAVNENMLWIMQNFASSTAPTQPVTGQSWFDTGSQVLKVYDGSSWIETGGVIRSNTAPANPSGQGVLWFDTLKKQLNVWSGTGWLLVGPLGAAANNDPVNPSIPPNSVLDAVMLGDGNSTHNAWRIVVAGALLAIISKDPEYTPNPLIPGFATIKPGINFNSTISNVVLNGDATLYRNNQDNIPVSSNQYNLGNPSYKFASVYATNFYGKATSAANADAATAAQSALIAENSNNLGGVAPSKFLRTDINDIPDTNLTYDLGSLSKQWKTVYAGNVVVNGVAVTPGGVSSITGTANQVIVTGAVNPILSLPQSIATTSTPRFSSVGLNYSAGPAGSITFGDGTVQTTAAGSALTYNLNVSAPATNINLAVGNKLILNFTNFTNLPLYTASVEGVYRLTLVCTNTNSENVDWQWFPNSVLTPVPLTDSFEISSILSLIGSSTPTGAQGTKFSGFMWFDLMAGPDTNPIADRGPFIMEFIASTYTASKMVMARSMVAWSVSINNAYWLNGTGSGVGSARLNTTTAWTSLGVMRLEPAASINTLFSGSMTIERLA